MHKQQELLLFHQHQFENVLNSELDATFLPENVKVLMTTGLTGIRHYLSMLNSVSQRHHTQQKETMTK